MQHDSVFKFVCLRSPSIAERAHSTTDALTTDAGSFALLDGHIAAAVSEAARGRIEMGARAFFGTSGFFGRYLGAEAVPWYESAEALIQRKNLEAAEFLENADALATQVGNLAKDESWSSDSLRNTAWSSYVAAVLVGTSAQRHIRGLLFVLRLMRGYDAAKAGTYGAERLALASLRVAIPARYLVYSDSPTSADAAPSGTEAPPPGTGSDASNRAQRLKDLLGAREAVRHAIAARTRRVMAAEKSWEESLKGVRTASKPEATSRQEGDSKTATISVGKLPDRKIDRSLTEADIASPEVVGHLKTWGLSLALGHQALIERLTSMIAAELQSAGGTGGFYRVAWNGKVFVRLFVTAPG